MLISSFPLSAWGFIQRHPGLIMVLFGVVGEVICDWEEMGGRLARAKKISAILLIFGLIIEFVEAARSDGDVSAAIERAGLAEKESADTRLAAVQLSLKVEELRQLNLGLEARTAPRNLRADQQSAIAREMSSWAKLPISGVPQPVAVFSVNGLYESLRLADQVAGALGPKGAGFSINRNAVTYGIPLNVAGVLLLASSSSRGTSVANALAKALNNQGITTQILVRNKKEDILANTDEASDASVSVWVGDHP